jgi:YVTN family beta-propeller protein
VINTTTNKAGLIKGFTSPDYIAITPNGKTAYFANGSSDVLAINTGTSKLGRQIKVGIRPVAIAITP